MAPDEKEKGGSDDELEAIRAALKRERDALRGETGDKDSGGESKGNEQRRNNNQQQQQKGGGQQGGGKGSGQQQKGGGGSQQQKGGGGSGGGQQRRRVRWSPSIVWFKRGVWTLGVVLTSLAIFPFIQWLGPLWFVDKQDIFGMTWFDIPASAGQFCVGAVLSILIQLFLTLMQNDERVSHNQRLFWRLLDAGANFASIRLLLGVMIAFPLNEFFTMILYAPIVLVVQRVLGIQWSWDGSEVGAIAIAFGILVAATEMIAISWWVAAYPEA